MMQSTLLLPSPKIANQKNLASSVQVLRSMNGTVFTYVKPKRGRKVQRWDFVTTKDNEDVFIGYITINPLEVSGEGRAVGFPSNEVYRWTLSLEEKV